jgi:hypothetical protein
MQPKHSFIALAAAALLAGHAAQAAETASFAVDTEVKITSDQRTRGVSDSLLQPGAKLSVQVAHESGLVALAELGTVSKTEFIDSKGYNLLLAGGWRFGDPEAWHFGIGAATEIFPSAKFEAPHGFDLATMSPTDFRTTNYNSSFAVFEISYGAIEGRVLNVISKTYRGADTGGVCGTMLALMADPTPALECYGRGDQDSRGSWLYDVGYKYDLSPATTLNLHAGHQTIRHFSEADFSDYSVGMTHQHWGFQWTAEWVTARTKVRELYLVADGDTLRATDGSRFVVTVSRKF